MFLKAKSTPHFLDDCAKIVLLNKHCTQIPQEGSAFSSPKLAFERYHSDSALLCRVRQICCVSPCLCPDTGA